MRRDTQKLIQNGKNQTHHATAWRYSDAIGKFYRHACEIHSRDFHMWRNIIQVHLGIGWLDKKKRSGLKIMNKWQKRFVVVKDGWSKQRQKQREFKTKLVDFFLFWIKTFRCIILWQRWRRVIFSKSHTYPSQEGCGPLKVFLLFPVLISNRFPFKILDQGHKTTEKWPRVHYRVFTKRRKHVRMCFGALFPAWLSPTPLCDYLLLLAWTICTRWLNT